MGETVLRYKSFEIKSYQTYEEMKTFGEKEGGGGNENRTKNRDKKILFFVLSWHLIVAKGKRIGKGRRVGSRLRIDRSERKIAQHQIWERKERDFLLFCWSAFLRPLLIARRFFGLAWWNAECRNIYTPYEVFGIRPFIWPEMYFPEDWAKKNLTGKSVFSRKKGGELCSGVWYSFFPSELRLQQKFGNLRKKTRKGKGGSRPPSLRDIKKKTILLQYFPAQAFSKRKKRKKPLFFSPLSRFVISRPVAEKRERKIVGRKRNNESFLSFFPDILYPAKRGSDGGWKR